MQHLVRRIIQTRVLSWVLSDLKGVLWVSWWSHVLVRRHRQTALQVTLRIWAPSPVSNGVSALSCSRIGHILGLTSSVSWFVRSTYISLRSKNSRECDHNSVTVVVVCPSFGLWSAYSLSDIECLAARVVAIRAYVNIARILHVRYI